MNARPSLPRASYRRHDGLLLARVFVCMKRLVLTLFLATMASAQDLGSYQKILFPVLSRTTVNGVGGSSFSTPLAAWAPHRITFYSGTLAVYDNIGRSLFPAALARR